MLWRSNNRRDSRLIGIGGDETVATIATLAKKYRRTPEEVKRISRECGTVPFTIDWELSESVTRKIVDVIIKEEQERLLSRKYIIFTLTAMEKSGTFKILKQIVELRIKNGTQSQLIVVSAAVDELKKDAEADRRRSYLMDNYELFNEMRKRGFLIVLQGSVAKEGLTIGDYIRTKCKGSDSILVLGKNMSLNTCVYLRNEGNMQMGTDGKKHYRSGYIPVEERGISGKGYLQFVKKADDPVFGPIGSEKFKIFKGKKYRVNVITTKISENKLQLRGIIPTVGNDVYEFRKSEQKWIPIRLESKLNSGGAEGGIYSISDNELCAKIFKKDSITERKMKKLELLCKKYEFLRGRDNSVIRRIAWPQTILYNEAHEPVGYIMRKFTGTIGFDEIVARKYAQFIDNKKENEIIAAVSLVELIRFLHENKVVLCDINRGNILFDKQQRAYLVDLDSAQITDQDNVDISDGVATFFCYPANVATPQFLSPEHIYDCSYTFRHHIADDVWSLQYMIFLLLTRCGAYWPYSNDATTKEGKNDIAKGNYCYFYNYTTRHIIEKNDPLYGMHCIISRLPVELQRAFYNSFSGKGKKFKAEHRYSAQVWMIWLVKYYYDLPKMIAEDSENGAFQPGTVKYVPSSQKGVASKIKVNELNKFLDNLDSWLTNN